MTKAFTNPKVFAAACLLFAGATMFNVTANASSNASGMSLNATPAKISAPVLEVGPTIPPNPWEGVAPASSASGRRRL
jgi:hypothetical protein